MHSPAAAALLLAPFLDAAPAACRLAMALLDERERLLGIALLDGARMSACCLRPADVYEPAIVAGASSMYLAHRHRSSQPYGLRPDFVSTGNVWTVAPQIGLNVHDHLIFDDRGRYASLRDSQDVWRTWWLEIKRTQQLVLPVSQPAPASVAHEARDQASVGRGAR